VPVRAQTNSFVTNNTEAEKRDGGFTLRTLQSYLVQDGVNKGLHAGQLEANTLRTIDYMSVQYLSQPIAVPAALQTTLLLLINIYPGKCTQV